LLGATFEPLALARQKKYSEIGSYSPLQLCDINIPARVKATVSRLGNLGISKATWSSYRSAERMWDRCQIEKDVTFELPVSLESVLIFIDFLTTDRNLSGATISCYLSGLRQMHLLRGLEPPHHLRSSLVKLVVKGKMNEDNIAKRRTGTARVAVTENIMLLLKDKIRSWDATGQDRLLVWAVCTIAFAGAFRIHELLCQLESTFDPDFELLGKGVVEHDTGRSISFVLQCPKEQKSAAPVVVDIFENTTELCPIKAYMKWRKKAKLRQDMPAFRWQDGTPFTGRKLNKILKELLKDHMTYASGKVTTHSFRSGIASMMAARGFAEDDIKAIGRWSSRAYEVYIKHPRTRRAELANKLC
jgi:hypothetical protein